MIASESSGSRLIPLNVLFGAPGVPCTFSGLVGGLCVQNTPGTLASLLSLKNLRRCPGSNERGLSDSQLTQGGTINCDPTERPIGP